MQNKLQNNEISEGSCSTLESHRLDRKKLGEREQDGNKIQNRNIHSGSGEEMEQRKLETFATRKCGESRINVWLTLT
jgi:hypothetical protein